jgi:hypothetical protein
LDKTQQTLIETDTTSFTNSNTISFFIFGKNIQFHVEHHFLKGLVTFKWCEAGADWGQKNSHHFKKEAPLKMYLKNLAIVEKTSFSL